MKTFKLFCLLLLVFSSNVFGDAQKTTIDEILLNPSFFNTRNVEVEGILTQWVKAETPTNTSYYLLKGEYGGVLKIHSTEVKAPEINEKYKVNGIFSYDRRTNTASLIENSRTCLSCMPIVPPPPPPLIPWWAYVLAGGIVLLFAFILIQKKRVTAGPLPEYSEPLPAPPVQNLQEKFPSPEVQKNYYPEPPTLPAETGDYKTIKISTATPKTLKFIPGELIITFGADKGKSFRIAGFPSEEGSVVTIGRREVTGDKSFSHIQLKERTVSKDQAEIISHNGKLALKNLSDTNYTQLNGVELMPGQCAELKPDSYIKVGEVEFQYKV